MTRDCDRDDIESLLEQIRDRPDWDVDDWDFAVGRFEQAELTVTLRWDPEIPDSADAASVLEAIEEHDDGTTGAPIEDVKTETGYPEAAEDTIRRLKNSGDVYEPAHGFIRRT